MTRKFSFFIWCFICQPWEESWDQGRTTPSWTMNSYKVRDYHKLTEVPSQLVNEDIGIPPIYSSKKKKSGGPDPRFRKVINTDCRSETEVGADQLGTQKVTGSLYGSAQGDRTLDDKVINFLKIPNDASFFTTPSLKKFNEHSIENCCQDLRTCLSNEVTKDPGFQSSNKYYGNCETTFPCGVQGVPNGKTYKDLDRVKGCSIANLKRSASDCTLNKKKPFDDENDDEPSERIRAYPSATRLTKVHDWMKDYNLFPEKRRSVITVIGQTQTKPFSKILSEINQRRKLAKELDRHALCEAIMQSAESQPDVKNLVAKVDLVLPDGKVIYSTEKVYLRRDNKFTDTGVYTHQSMETLDAGGEFISWGRLKCADQKNKIFQMIPERDSSLSQLGRRSRTKRSGKKSVAPIKEKLKVTGSIKNICYNFSSLLFWSFLGMLCLSFCFSAFVYTVKPSQNFFVVEFFKPKTTAWYEKLLF